MSKGRVTVKEVQQLGEKWAPRLHVTDWEIEYGVADLAEAAGTCTTDWTKQQAHITIDDGMPGVFSGFKGVRAGRSTESVVIHELLHILQSPNLGDLRDKLKDHPEIEEALVDLSERMIDLFVRILLEAEYSLGPWAKAA